MKPRDQFALALRIIGVLGITYLVRAWIRNPTPPMVPLIARVACIFIGAYFIRGASVLVNFAYPESTTESAEKRVPEPAVAPPTKA